jgi:hypothetical protein
VGRGTAEVCDARPWSLEELAPSLDAETTRSVASAAVQAVAVADAEAARLRAELATGGADAAAPRVDGDTSRAERIERWRLRLVESILTLKCPRCQHVFADYDGCDSLTCGNHACGAFFCALCLSPFASNAACHAHVANARHHADGFVGLHGGQERFHRFHAQRRRALINARVAAVPEDDAFREQLRRLLLADAEIEEEVGQDDQNGGQNGEAGGDGSIFGMLWQGLEFVGELLGDRAHQRHPFVKGVQAVVDLAPLVAGGFAALRGVAPQQAAAAAPAARNPRAQRQGSSTSSIFIAAGAGAVLAGGIAAAISTFRDAEGEEEAAPVENEDARALSRALGRPLTRAELALSPEELRERLRNMLD